MEGEKFNRISGVDRLKTYLKTVCKRIRLDIKKYKWTILIFVIFYVIIKKIFKAFCPLVILTGFPCPACGMTRAILFLLTGQFERSFRIHPMAILWVILALYCIIMRYLLGKRVAYFKSIVIVLLLAMIVYYIYRMITLFPNQPPMSYTRNNLLHRVIVLWQAYFVISN